MNPVMVYQLQGAYSYERIEDPEIKYERYIKDEVIESWIEHCLQNVIPYTHIKITIEVSK